MGAICPTVLYSLALQKTMQNSGFLLNHHIFIQNDPIYISLHLFIKFRRYDNSNLLYKKTHVKFLYLKLTLLSLVTTTVESEKVRIVVSVTLVPNLVIVLGE